MTTPIAVVFMHGINASRNDYADGMRDRLIEALPKGMREAVTFRSIFWADIVRVRQKDYWTSATATTSFSPNPLHKLVLEGLGDAAAYQKTRDYRNSAYYAIQARIRETFNSLDEPQFADRPLVIIAHSLGCHIMSSYAWDLHKIKQLPADSHGIDEPTREFVRWTQNASPFMRLDTFCGFVTMGSNMPLFTFMFGPGEVIPITRTNDPRLKPAFPGSALLQDARSHAQWLNFFSTSDPLGYPLKPLNAAYQDEPLLTDVPVVSEGRLRATLQPRALNALSAHTGYWKNRQVITKTAKLLQTLIGA